MYVCMQFPLQQRDASAAWNRVWHNSESPSELQRLRRRLKSSESPSLSLSLAHSPVYPAVNYPHWLPGLSNALQIKSLTPMCHCISILQQKEHCIYSRPPGGGRATELLTCPLHSQLVFHLLESIVDILITGREHVQHIWHIWDDIELSSG